MMMPDRPQILLRAWAAALLLAFPGGRAGAQAIVGRVTDAASGAAVPGARVTVSGRGRGQQQQTVTGSDGRYSIALAGGGTVRVQATRTGYDPARSRAVAVGPHDTVRADLRMPPAAVHLRGLTATARRRRLNVNGVFVQIVSAADSLALRPTSAAGRPRVIQARGPFIAPSPCYQLAGVADRLGAVVTLYIQARATGDDLCPTYPTAFKYNATVRGLQPGSYTFRVIHVFVDARQPPGLALDTTMTVP